ncbi:hypothetical protein SAMN05443377_12237 [Propionibacterium cyclohexanicum]|mgnify:CR=1 FL=1|uniref:Uncharacterized protein n=1 Tax=Propionibacterium cyclohexanicum TaxID=64702 RepID=A0A1H9TFQ9_9ACTN|nr:hypothetical protein [Propionibacterium cyclohexanicum]SER95948.1 hypothetical protein SAMN05443377_12237 [Propionibacterium cyclohexanicum]
MTSPSITNGRNAERQEMTSALTQMPTKDETRRAINLVVGLGRPELQKTLAQVIAGAIADADHTAMQQFAATGEVDTEALLDELDRVEVPFEEEAWVDALARYVLFISGGRQ